MAFNNLFSTCLVDEKLQRCLLWHLDHIVRLVVIANTVWIDNEDTLLACSFRHGLAPISTDYLQPSYDQLRIELYQGSVTQKDARLRGFDLVTSIEL